MRRGAGRWVQSAHWAGPLPTLIMWPLWPSVRLHPWPWCGFQEPFVKQRSRKWGWFAAVSQAWGMCLREPHLSRHVDHAGSLPDGELMGVGVISRRRRWRQSWDLQCICNGQRHHWPPDLLYYWENPGDPKPTDWWGFMANGQITGPTVVPLLSSSPQP